MNIGSNAQNFITPDELSKLLKISKSSVYRLVDSRVLPFYKFGGNLRFSSDDVSCYLSETRVEPIEKQYERN